MVSTTGGLFWAIIYKTCEYGPGIIHQTAYSLSRRCTVQTVTWTLGLGFGSGVRFGIRINYNGNRICNTGFGSGIVPNR
jgi:hypothetical protein